MKFPQRLKYRKFFKVKLKIVSLVTLKSAKLVGKSGLQSLEQGKMSPSEIEACRVSIRRNLGRRNRKKRRVKLWIRLFPYCWVSKKAVSMRMGKGKGNHEGWYAPVYKGKILYELDRYEKGNCNLSYFKSFRKAWRKLSIYTKLALLKY